MIVTGQRSFAFTVYNVPTRSGASRGSFRQRRNFMPLLLPYQSRLLKMAGDLLKGILSFNIQDNEGTNTQSTIGLNGWAA